MPFRPFENQNCSIARAAEIFADRWTPLIMREVLLGRRRFTEIKRHTGAASNILTDRLNTLVERGLLERVVSEAAGERYVPTKKGIDSQGILLAMLAWGDKYEYPDGAPREIVHEKCNHVMHPMTACSHCGEIVKPADVTIRPGPAANERQRDAGAFGFRGTDLDVA